MRKEENLGYIFAVMAFVFWGAIAPIYFKQVADISPLEVLMHRILWSFVIVIPLIFITKNFGVFKETFLNKKKLILLCFSTIFVSVNWLLFIWAITTNHIMEAALGYYINPLVNTFLGYVIFKEKMTRNQYIAIFVALLAVLYQLYSIGTIPLISLSLALSFALYGMVRKKAHIGSIVGLSIEVVLLMPLSIAYLLYLINTNTLGFLNVSTYTSIMLSLGGLATVIPLLFFNGAATRMKLSTLGFFQYISPTLAFFVALFIYNEDFSFHKFITFALIWFALLLFSLDTIRNRKKAKKIE